MAYTLKASGLATHLQFCIAVDQDGTTVREFVSSAVNTDMVVNANVTVASATWKGAGRGYFETKANGTFDFFGITFGANKPPFDLSAAQRAYFFAAAGASAGGGTQELLTSSAGANVLRRSGLDKAEWFVNSGSRGAGTTSIPSDGTTKFSFGSNWLTNSKADFYYGLESGSLAADGTNNPGAFGSNSSLAELGGTSGGGNFPGKWHLVAGFDTNLSLGEFQSLHDDWFGTLFDVAGGTALDEDGEWIITTRSW